MGNASAIQKGHKEENIAIFPVFSDKNKDLLIALITKVTEQFKCLDKQCKYRIERISRNLKRDETLFVCLFRDEATGSKIRDILKEVGLVQQKSVCLVFFKNKLSVKTQSTLIPTITKTQKDSGSTIKITEQLPPIQAKKESKTRSESTKRRSEQDNRSKRQTVSPSKELKETTVTHERQTFSLSDRITPSSIYKERQILKNWSKYPVPTPREKINPHFLFFKNTPFVQYWYTIGSSSQAPDIVEGITHEFYYSNETTVEKFLMKELHVPKVNIFCNKTCSKELKEGVKDFFGRKLKLEYVINSDHDRHMDEHLFIICCGQSRLNSDIELVVRELLPRYAKKYCIIYLRHREPYTLATDSFNRNVPFLKDALPTNVTSSTNLVPVRKTSNIKDADSKKDKYVQQFGGVIDCIYDSTNNIYDCDVNTKAGELILHFFKTVQIGSGSSTKHVPGRKITGSDSADPAPILAKHQLTTKPWREIGQRANLDDRLCKSLVDEIGSMKALSPTKQLNIAIIGRKCAGKSSFINTIKSHYMKYVSKVARTGEAASSITNKYSTYNVSGNAGNQIWLCDTRGIDQNFGLHSNDFKYLLNGQIQDGYQFDPKKPITSIHDKFLKKPTLNDRIHCVCFVFDGNALDGTDEDTYNTLIKFLEQIGEQDNLSYVILLTKMDKVCDFVSKDISKMYRSKEVEKLVNEVSSRLKIESSMVVPVVNYISQTETNVKRDAIALLALRQMLRRCNDFISTITTKEDKLKIQKQGPTKK